MSKLVLVLQKINLITLVVIRSLGLFFYIYQNVIELERYFDLRGENLCILVQAFYKILYTLSRQF